MLKKVIVNEKGNKIYWSKGDVHTSNGIIKEKDVKKGGIVKTHKGKKYIVFDASFVDKLDKIKRGPAITHKKDVGVIVSNTGLGSGWKVVDAGAGSGYLAIILSRLIYPGKLVSYEINEDFLNIVKKNIKFLDIKNLKLRNMDIYKGIKEKNLDLITLDLLEPHKVVKHAKKSLKCGGFLVAYTTNISQLRDFVNELNKNKFYVEKVTEIMEREWHVEGLRIRPKSQMLGHTAFLTFARNV